MKISISEKAAKWYKDELITSTTGYVRFFPRYGFGGHIPGFAIGVNSDRPENIHASTQADNVTFYIEEKDAWYFDGLDLDITWNETLHEPDLNVNQS